MTDDVAPDPRSAARRRRQTETPMKRTALTLHVDVLDAVDSAVAEGQAINA